ncbi:uncharacterized protein KY384_003284 [Bacidia gigantensis]|uniref:uncharacterized protein n=1 Tax=Bacidia gigantensis TaxID=2732470 RepID=UPI001D0390EA|nr:uncharacterized protein KY384_003284 [Bacidia gigantensis]KAG8531653.1 hypothetical protein KY384_003284 [Bacidia gigantensis]
MTDLLPDNNTHIAPAVQPNTHTLRVSENPPPSLYNAHLANEPQVEDDSTIKCICGFKHDDGLSVFCEKCNTWQHTECYYYDEKNDRVPQNHELDAISHFCTDCEPRWIDVQAAINRQKLRMGDIEPDEKKLKKAASKSHKKKVRATENGVLTNGWSPTVDVTLDRTSRSPRDQPLSAKRPKANHRTTQSLALSQNSTFQPHKRSASLVLSPTKQASKRTPNGFVKEHYSDEFMRLYDNDIGEQDMQTNLLGNINITHDLSTWVYDVDALHVATRGFSQKDVFYRIERPLDEIIGPLPQKRIREDANVLRNGQCPRWIYLTSSGPSKWKSIIGELKGKIGHMNDYISDPENRWDYLRHPAPFVFFHPRLPIYIDTRSEGTLCRYLRRSCRPNLSMTTILENSSEYHFCFTAKQDIEDGAEMTIGWTLDEHMRKFISNKNDMAKDLSPDAEEYITDWVGKVSSEFGGCACGMPDSCWLVRYDPENKGLVRSKGHSRRRQTTNIHANSDAEDAESTSRSTSGSPDLTPTGSASQGPALGLEISDREKRKIAALEKTLDGDKHQPAPKKKKRNSGGSSANVNGPGISKPLIQATSLSQPNTPGFTYKSQYIDVGIGKTSDAPVAKAASILGHPRNNTIAARKAWSNPNTPTTSSPLARSTYVDMAVQVDMDDENDWYNSAPALSKPSKPRKPYMSLTKRLLLRSQQDRQRLEEKRRSSEASTNQQSLSNHANLRSPSNHVDIGVKVSGRESPEPQCDQQDFSPGQPRSPPSANPGPPPWPSNTQTLPINGIRPPNLIVQLPPKRPQAPDSASSTPLTQTPISTLPPTLFPTHTPLQPPSTGGSLQPSPAKKKVSLSDYIKRKGSSTDAKHGGAVSPELSHGISKPPLSASNCDAAMEGSAIVDTPKREEANPMDFATTERMKTISPVPEETKMET